MKYAYVRRDNTVGQIFDDMPPPGLFSPEYRERILPVQDEVQRGWTYNPESGAYAAPPPREPRDEYTIDKALAVLLGG